MITRSLILKLFNAANMQRWNDKIRPVELRELDKQAHKMIIAFVLGKQTEATQIPTFDWKEIIEISLFELLQRIVLTDLKPQLFDKIRSDRNTYKELNEWVFTQLKTELCAVHPDFPEKFRRHFFCSEENINRTILHAAHTYASLWEFEILKRADPYGRELAEIQQYLERKLDGFFYSENEAMFPLETNLAAFINLCGELRFQVRWSHMIMLPRISVLGHMLIVALLSFLLSIELKACRTRCINNYFTGLFHDLPEVLTRDIIDPVKRSVAGLSSLIKEYEKKEMEQKVLLLLPPDMRAEMRLYTEMEFENYVFDHGRKKNATTEEINKKYNQDEYSPRDGKMIRACDQLAAFYEAELALKNGIGNQEVRQARDYLYHRYKDLIIGGIKIGDLFADIDGPSEGMPD